LTSRHHSVTSFYTASESSVKRDSNSSLTSHREVESYQRTVEAWKQQVRRRPPLALQTLILVLVGGTDSTNPPDQPQLAQVRTTSSAGKFPTLRNSTSEALWHGRPPKYVRTLYAFLPGHNKKTKCLSFSPNHVIYVHTLHPSVWEEGTLFASHERRWFPLLCERHALSNLLPLKVVASGLLFKSVREKRVSGYSVYLAWPLPSRDCWYALINDHSDELCRCIVTHSHTILNL
jgi:hypothetical protein